MFDSPTLLVTGGAGYIGSHTVLELIAAGYRPVVLDNLSNSSRVALERIHKITGQHIEFIEGDIRHGALLDRIFQDMAERGSPVQCVLHFAGLKAVGESVAEPLRYYDTNVSGTVVLLQAMARAGVNNIVFSSSATVYGEPLQLPYIESHPIAPANPYGWSKAMVERILEDYCLSRPEFTAVVLRYFNPIGAHESGLIGEDPRGTPNNLFPFITQVAVGKLPRLRIFGNDYPTQDGTGVRDYLHVSDLAVGHVKAVEYATRNSGGFAPINLGTGRGTSVLELVRAFEQATGRKIPFEVQARRPGDTAATWADPGSAERLLGWRAERGVESMCRDGWRWQSGNPAGYAWG